MTMNIILKLKKSIYNVLRIIGLKKAMKQEEPTIESITDKTKSESTSEAKPQECYENLTAKANLYDTIINTNKPTDERTYEMIMRGVKVMRRARVYAELIDKFLNTELLTAEMFRNLLATNLKGLDIPHDKVVYFVESNDKAKKTKKKVLSKKCDMLRKSLEENHPEMSSKNKDILVKNAKKYMKIGYESCLKVYSGNVEEYEN